MVSGLWFIPMMSSTRTWTRTWTQTQSASHAVRLTQSHSASHAVRFAAMIAVLLRFPAILALVVRFAVFAVSVVAFAAVFLPVVFVLLSSRCFWSELEAECWMMLMASDPLHAHCRMIFSTG